MKLKKERETVNVEMVKKIHRTPFKFFIAIAGGGQSFIGDFCKISGASNNLIGALVPYNQQVFNEFIGKTPDQYVSSEGARGLAVASYLKCLSVGVKPEFAIGIGCSSSIVKDNEREGRKHRSFIAIHCNRYTYVVQLTLLQRRTRLEEEVIITGAIFETLSYACGIQSFTNCIQTVCRQVDDYHFDYNNYKNYAQLLNNEIEYHYTYGDLKDIDNITLVGGSFNPLHESHRFIYKTASHLLKQQCYYEISVINADKGTLDFIEIDNRARGLGDFSYILTNKPTLKEKVDLFKKINSKMKINFALGVDTWNRIWNPKYGYLPGDLESFFTDNDVKFLLFTRKGIEPAMGYGKSLIIDTISNPFGDVSSTQIRKERIENEQRRN